MEPRQYCIQVHTWYAILSLSLCATMHIHLKRHLSSSKWRQTMLQQRFLRHCQRSARVLKRHHSFDGHIESTLCANGLWGVILWFCSRPGHVQGGGKKEITGQRLSSGAVKTLFQSQDIITLSTISVMRVKSIVPAESFLQSHWTKRIGKNSWSGSVD